MRDGLLWLHGLAVRRLRLLGHIWSGRETGFCWVFRCVYSAGADGCRDRSGTVMDDRFFLVPAGGVDTGAWGDGAGRETAAGISGGIRPRGSGEALGGFLAGSSVLVETTVRRIRFLCRMEGIPGSP